MLGTSVKTTVSREAAPAVRKGVRDALLDAADVGFATSQERVADNSTDTGFLLESGVQPEVLGDGTIVWGYNAPHAPYVEFGTAPHWPPIEPLKGWARRVLGDESAAYAVQQKIAEEGTDPEPFVRPGVEAMRRSLESKKLPAIIESNLEDD